MLQAVGPSVEWIMSELSNFGTYKSIKEDITTQLYRFPVKDSSTGTGRALAPAFKALGDARRNLTAGRQQSTCHTSHSTSICSKNCKLPQRKV